MLVGEGDTIQSIMEMNLISVRALYLEWSM